jgi:hypothetical protein
MSQPNKDPILGSLPDELFTYDMIAALPADITAERLVTLAAQNPSQRISVEESIAVAVDLIVIAEQVIAARKRIAARDGKFAPKAIKTTK